MVLFCCITTLETPVDTESRLSVALMAITVEYVFWMRHDTTPYGTGRFATQPAQSSSSVN